MNVLAPLSPLVPLFAATLAGAPAIDWSAPPGCPTQEVVIEEASRLGADLEGAPYSMQGAIEVVEGGYALDLSIETATGTTDRRLEADSCAALGSAAALVLVVALDPFALPVAPAIPEPPPPREPAPPPMQVRAVSTPSTSASLRKPLPVRGAAIASGVVGRGISPGVDGRAQLGVGLDVAWLRAELLGFHAFARRATYHDRPEVGARIGGWGASLRAGPRFAVAPIELACPLGVVLAGVLGSGFGAERNWQRAELHVGILLAPGVRGQLGERFALGADAEIEVALRRPAFALDDLGEVHRTARIGARGGLRLEMRFSGRSRDRPAPTRRPR